MKCPDCDGGGKITAFFVLRTDGGCDPCRELPCIRCGGSGAVPDEMLAWMATGKTMREARKSRGNTLRKEAEERKVEPSELAAMEQGRVRPNPKPS